MLIVYSILGLIGTSWIIVGNIVSIVYVLAFHRFGIPEERQWLSLVWRVTLCPIFWPLILVYEFLDPWDL